MHVLPTIISTTNYCYGNDELTSQVLNHQHKSFLNDFRICKPLDALQSKKFCTLDFKRNPKRMITERDTVKIQFFFTAKKY